MGEEKQQWFTRLDASESEFVEAIGDPLIEDRSEKLRLLVRAVQAWVGMGIVSLGLSDIQVFLCQFRQQEQLQEAAAGVATESRLLPPKKPMSRRVA